jgi:hypothetical protein
MSRPFLSSNDSFILSNDSEKCKKMNVFGNGLSQLLIKSNGSSYSMPSISPVKPINELSPHCSKPYSKPYLING